MNKIITCCEISESMCHSSCHAEIIFDILQDCYGLTVALSRNRLNSPSFCNHPHTNTSKHLTSTFHAYSCHTLRSGDQFGTGFEYLFLRFRRMQFSILKVVPITVITPFTNNNADNHFLMHIFDDLKEIR